MANNQSPQLLANGNILPSTFVKLDTTQDESGLQAGANAQIIGIAQEGSDGTPGVLTSTYAAVANESFKLYGLGDICLLVAGSGGWTRGDLLVSDSAGGGITVPTTGAPQNVGAIALQSCTAGLFGLVQIVIFQVTPATSGTGTFSTLTMTDGGNIVAGATTGTDIGTNVNQKIGFWGVTPVIQPSSTGELIGLNGNAATTANATNMNSNGNLGATLYDFNDVIKALKQVGVLKQ